MSDTNISHNLKSNQSPDDISCPVIKKDHYEKMGGRAEYILDRPFKDLYESAFVRSTVPHGRILSVKVPDLPDGYHTVEGKDVPFNRCHNIGDEQPVFSDEEVRFIGEAILMIAGPDKCRFIKIFKGSVQDILCPAAHLLVVIFL
ncbi:MAG: hypothetical protein K6E33_07540, partial [Lachnospiraceae bacterium]|nr:hypothetical protein [Lachnospiraceae bacterium]